jgi:hypothetical protein
MGCEATCCKETEAATERGLPEPADREPKDEGRTLAALDGDGSGWVEEEESELASVLNGEDVCCEGEARAGDEAREDEAEPALLRPCCCLPPRPRITAGNLGNDATEVPHE